jgi:hypothetical protein
MPVDWHRLMPQIEVMTSKLKTAQEEQRQHLQMALDTLHKCDTTELKKKIANSRTTWLVADPMENLSNLYDNVACPRDYHVVAADGSQIDVDRHGLAHCLLINLGAILLSYGSKADAQLSCQPMLYSEQADMVIADPATGRQESVQGAILGLKRTVAECQLVVDLLDSLSSEHPALGLLDGSLVLWALERQTYETFVREAILDKGLLPSLNKIKELSQSRKLALASYISYPGSTEVINILKVALCPYDPADCDRNCWGKRQAGNKPCDVVSGLRDRDIFSRVLKPGQRSALFMSRSSILKHYGDHQICFFYVCLEGEIARVELPIWVAQNKAALELTHSLILEQCRKGQGYPVALGEAHEQAVVTGADREQFWKLVKASFIERHLTEQVSAKSSSKRTRWL